MQWGEVGLDEQVPPLGDTALVMGAGAKISFSSLSRLFPRRG